jgi:hypothetical protein
MSRFIKPLLCLCLIVLCAGKASKHSVWFVVSNNSSDGRPVDMKFSIAGKAGEIGALLGEQQIKAGLQHLPEKKLKEGVYQLQVAAANDLVGTSQPFTLDSDRWVLINYMCEDSANIVKTYGYIDPARFKKIDGKYATLYISIANRKPAGL